MNTWTDDSTHVRDAIIVAFLRHQGRDRRTIASQLGLSKDRVDALITESRQYTELRFVSPGSEELEVRLIESFDLKEAVVVENDLGEEPEARTAAIGQAAARYFLAHVHPCDHVALSCGSTTLEMLKALPTRRDLTLTISQMSTEADPKCIHVAPSTLVGLLRAKCGPATRCEALQLPPPGQVDRGIEAAYRQALRVDVAERMREAARGARLVFVGIGVPEAQPDAPQSFLQLARHVVGERLPSVFRELNIVGEINNQFFDSSGVNRTAEIPGIEDMLVHILSLEDIRMMAQKREEHSVVALATGKAKTDAIRTALRCGLCNVVITGREDAERLLG